MRLLLTNDDGVQSPWTRKLSQFLKNLDFVDEVKTVCPSTERSGVGHAFTFQKPLEVQEIADDVFSVSGMPSDCVKFAVHQLYTDSPPDLIISGPNQGHNAGVAVFYSGTVAAAREGALWGIPSMALSLYPNDQLAFAFLKSWLAQFLSNQVHQHIVSSQYWNINLPVFSHAEFSPDTVFTKMSTVMYVDEYLATDAPHAWVLKGDKPQDLFIPGTDDWAISQGQIAVVPFGLDHSITIPVSSQIFNKLNPSKDVK